MKWSKTPPTKDGIYWYRQKVAGRWGRKCRAEIRGKWTTCDAEVILNPEAEQWAEIEKERK